MYIGKFHHGVSHGFFRLWDNGVLKDIGYKLNGKKSGKWWTLHKSNKMFLNIDNWDEALLLSKDRQVTAGKK